MSNFPANPPQFGSPLTFGSDPFANGGGGGSGGGPGSTICGLLGLSPSCSWLSAIAAGYNELFGGGGAEPPSGDQPVPGGGVSSPGFAPPTTTSGGQGPCPGLFSVRGPNGQCINLGDLAPGGSPAMTPQQGTPVAGWYGVGLAPTQVTRTVRQCPPGFALGKDGVCYDGLPRGKRAHDPGRRPLLTGGDMAAITKARQAAGRLLRTQKSLKKTARAIEKAV